MPTVTADDRTAIAYRTFGTGSRTVMLVHGWMVSGAVYNDLLEHFDVEGLRIIVPDLRGTGASDKPATGYSIERHARDVLAVADHEGVGSFALVGHSMGGQIAQWIASEQPVRVSGTLLLCPVPASGMALPEDAKALFRSSPGNRGAQGTILGLACKRLSDAAKEKLLDDAAGVCDAAILEGFEAWTAGGFKDRLSGIRTPTLVVATDDPFMPPDFLRQTVVAPIQGARLSVLPGPGHYPQVEMPRETSAVIQAFLAGLG